MKERDLLANEFELEARNRNLSRLDRAIKVITYSAWAIVVLSMLFVRGVAQHIIFLIAFILMVSANLFGLYRGQKFKKYIWNSLNQGIEAGDNDE